MAFLRQCLQELRARQPGEQDLAGLLLLDEMVSLPARVMPHLPAPPGASVRGMDITVVPARTVSASILEAPDLACRTATGKPETGLSGPPVSQAKDLVCNFMSGQTTLAASRKALIKGSFFRLAR